MRPRRRYVVDAAYPYEDYPISEEYFDPGPFNGNPVASGAGFGYRDVQNEFKKKKDALAFADQLMQDFEAGEISLAHLSVYVEYYPYWIHLLMTLNYRYGYSVSFVSFM